MKKYWKLFPVLALVLVLLAGCGKEKSTAEPQHPDTSADTAVEEVSALTCSNGSTTLRFARDEDGAWFWFDDPGFPLDEQQITSAVDALASMEGHAVSKNILANYGLDDPKKSATVTIGEDDTTYSVGKKQDDGSIYCNTESDAGTIYETPKAITRLMSRSIYDLAKLPEFPQLTADTIQSVKIVRGKNTVSLTVSDGKWLLDGKDVSKKAASLADTLNNLSFDKCVDYAPSKGAASICGLKKPAAVMTVTYGSNADSASKLVLTIGDTYHDGYFALLNKDTTIYQLSADLAAPILSLAKNGI